jgi:hypothetical protein
VAPVETVVIFVFACAVVGVVGYLSHQADKRKRGAAVALATQRGFTIDVDDKEPPPLGFDLFEIGRSKQVSDHIWPPGSQDSAFHQ